MPWCASTLWAQTAVGPAQSAWQNRVGQLQPLSAHRTAAGRSGAATMDDEASEEAMRKQAEKQRSRLKVALEDIRGLRGPQRVLAKPTSPRRDQQQRQQSPPRARTTEPHSDDELPPLSARYLAALEARRDEVRRRNAEHWDHLRTVQRAADDRRQEKVQRVQADIVFKAKRFLDPIDRYQDDPEMQQGLRASALHKCALHALFVLQLFHKLRRHKAMQVFQVLLVPIIMRWRLHRAVLARRYLALWRGQIARPSVERLIEVMPALSCWPIAAVARLRWLLRPRLFNRGTFIAKEGEPITFALIIDKGTVLVCQRVVPAKSILRSLATAAGGVGGGVGGMPTSKAGAAAATKGANAQWRVLGERGPGSLHGEEALQEGKANFFASIRCIEAVEAWVLSRRHFQRVAVTVPLSLTQSAAKNSERPPRFAVPAMKIMDNKCFHGWSEEQILDLIDTASLVTVPRGALLYAHGDVAPSSYIVWKGTLERQSYTVPPAFLQSKIAPAVNGKSFMNPNDAFGEESVIFAKRRESTVTAVTDAALFEIPSRELMDGLLRNPSVMLRFMNQLCQQRAAAMVKPTAADLSGVALQAQAAAHFIRTATPLVALSGFAALPLHTAVVVVASGRVLIDDVPYEAPCALCTFDVFSSRPTMLRHRCDTLVEVWVADAQVLATKLRSADIKDVLGPQSNMPSLLVKLLSAKK